MPSWTRATGRCRCQHLISCSVRNHICMLQLSKCDCDVPGQSALWFAPISALRR